MFNAPTIILGSFLLTVLIVYLYQITRGSTDYEIKGIWGIYDLFVTMRIIASWLISAFVPPFFEGFRILHKLLTHDLKRVSLLVHCFFLRKTNTFFKVHIK